MRPILADLDRYTECLQRAAMSERPAAASQPKRVEVLKYGSNAVIPVSGPLVYRQDFWSRWMGATDYDTLGIQLALASSDPDVSRIVFLFDTPGGEVTGITELASAIAASSKPTTAFVDPMCASAGIWLASQCSEIVSIPSGEIGSIGVQIVHVSYADYFKENKLDVKVYRASISPKKNIAHPYEPRSEEADKYLQSRVDKWGQKFIEAVARGRNVASADVLAKFGQGRMLDADDAVEVGLIDRIDSMQNVLNSLRTKDVRRITSSKIRLN